MSITPTIRTVCFFLIVTTSVQPAFATPDPAIDMDKAWTSLQAISGSWTPDDGQSQLEWKQVDQNRLKKIVSESGKERVIGQLIREKDKIVYELAQQEEKVRLELKQFSGSSWIFASGSDRLLRKVQLTLIDEGILRNEVLAQSPSGRRFRIHSEMSRL